MSQFLKIILFSLISLFAYLFSISSLSFFTPQLLAFLAIILIFTIFLKKTLVLSLVVLIINLLIFYTNGLNSPAFFLIYFLLFVIAFQNPPTVSLAYSIVLIIFLSQSLNSLSSIFPLLSLLFITPLVWFTSKQHLDNVKLNSNLSDEETNILLWLSLKFKTGISQIIDSASVLLSNPNTTFAQKKELHKIKDSAKSLLNSSKNLKNEIEND